MDLTWEVSLDGCGVQVVRLFKTLAADVVESVEAKAAISGCEREKRKKGVEEVHCAFWFDFEARMF